MKKMKILALLGAMVMLLMACGADSHNAETVPTETTESNMVTVTYYHRDGSANRLVADTAKLEKLTAQNLIDLLTEQEMLPEGVRVLNFQQENGIITLNVSAELGEAFQDLSSSKGRVLLGSLVNTFLDVYNADGIDLTSAGRHLEGGHKLYNDILEFFE